MTYLTPLGDWFLTNSNVSGEVNKTDKIVAIIVTIFCLTTLAGVLIIMKSVSNLN